MNVTATMPARVEALAGAAGCRVDSGGRRIAGRRSAWSGGWVSRRPQSKTSDSCAARTPPTKVWRMIPVRSITTVKGIPKLG